jgi:hypothetical protein
VLRVVGYTEYREALARLDALVARATEEELRVFDSFVASRDEFTVYSNLARRLEQAQQPAAASTLSEPGGGPQRGLGWVLGLARVELAAMAAVYTEAEDPFALLPPSQFEWPQYQELLLDGARTHHLALGADPAARNYASYRDALVTLDHVESGRPEINSSHAIAYGRRILLAQSFVQAAGKHLGTQLQPEQLAELQSWQSDLATLQHTLLAKVLCLAEIDQTTTRELTREYEEIRGARACYQRFAKRELDAGRATLGPARSN